MNMLILPPRYCKLLPLIVASLTLVGLILHCASANSVDGAAGVVFSFMVLILSVPLILRLSFPRCGRFVLSAFFLFFAIYFFFSGFARINAAIFNPDQIGRAHV